MLTGVVALRLFEQQQIGLTATGWLQKLGWTRFTITLTCSNLAGLAGRIDVYLRADWRGACTSEASESYLPARHQWYENDNIKYAGVAVWKLQLIARIRHISIIINISLHSFHFKQRLSAWQRWPSAWSLPDPLDIRHMGVMAPRSQRFLICKRMP